MSCVFCAGFWSQRQQAGDEIVVVCVLKHCFFVTAVYGEDLCQILINECIIAVAAGIQMKLLCQCCLEAEKPSGILRVLKSCSKENVTG